ncbi:MAG TPA: putative molybdenum carrier protein [Chthoniobacterales bacterium]
MKLLKIISGGQTGVDRGALDAAIEIGVDCGGWCPSGRMAEDGSIPNRYPVMELANAGYAERTLRNVADSDGTLLILHGRPLGGTRETIECCVGMQKPYLTIDCSRIEIGQAINLGLQFIAKLPSGHATITMNVAGPRASQWPQAHEITRRIVSGVLRRLSGQNDARAYSS